MRGSARKIAVVGGKPPAAAAPYGRRAPRHAGGRPFGAPRQSAAPSRGRCTASGGAADRFAAAHERCGDGRVCGDAAPSAGTPGSSARCFRRCAVCWMRARARMRKSQQAPADSPLRSFSGKRYFSMILCFTSGGECDRIIERLTAALSFRPPFSRYLAAREAKIRKGSKLL